MWKCILKSILLKTRESDKLEIDNWFLKQRQHLKPFNYTIKIILWTGNEGKIWHM